MKYKSRPNSLSSADIITNTITTYNLKIKNIHILLDDITTDKASKNIDNIKRSNSLQNNNEFLQKFSTMTYNNSHKFIYNKKRFNTRKSKEDKDKSVKSIPINFKKTDTYKNTEITIPSFLTTTEGFYTPNLTGLISERNHLNKKIFFNQTNCTDICCKMDNILDNNDKIYIKKNNKDKNRCSYRRSLNKNNIVPIIFRTKIINNKRNRNSLNIKSKTLNLKNCQDNVTIKPPIEKKKIKIKFNKKESKTSIKSKKVFSNNLKFIIRIQNWWKKVKSKSIAKKVIHIQKVFKAFLKRKYINDDKNRVIINKIPKDNNYNHIYFVSKLNYRNNIVSIILIQKYFKRHLTKIHFYNSSYIHFNIQKPEIKVCFITKGKKQISSLSNIKNITFGIKRLNTISKKKRNLNFKSLINNYNCFSYNFTTKNYNLKSGDNSFISMNNSEIHDLNNNDIINKFTYEIVNKNNNNNNKDDNDLHDLFIRSIFYKLNSFLFQVGYKYKSLLNFINSIDLLLIKNKLVLFFENFSYYDTKKINFINNIRRHINIYKKNNYIKNEIIELIENNLPKEINYEKYESLMINFTSEQEYNLINTQIFKEDNDLMNYIYLFFKYEKNKKINTNFIENRLIKEPLNYRNIFTILRYIDNLDEKINNNKICTNCFCKTNERICSLNCGCHFPINKFIINSHDMDNKNKKRISKTYQINQENIENNPNIMNIESRNLIRNFNEKHNIKNIFENNFIRGMRINKTFHYFNK